MLSLDARIPPDPMAERAVLDLMTRAISGRRRR
jgi:hypothetical protein